MRILHVSSSIAPVSGGTAIALAGMLPAQAAAGLDVRLLSTWQAISGEDAVKELESAGVKTRLVGKTFGKLSRHPQLAGVVQEMVADSDVVHIHGLWEEVQHQASIAVRQASVPYLFTPHGMLDPWSLAQGKWKKRFYLAWRLRRDLNGAAAIHFTSDKEQELSAPLALHPKSFVEPIGIDLIEFDNLPQGGEFRRAYPQLEQKLIVLFLGRLHHKKGLDVLIPAFARSACPSAMLVIAGPDAGYLQLAKDLVNFHGLADRTIFTGMLHGRDRLAAFVDADLFVLPSYQENFGISVLESLAVGTPVIISDQVNIHRKISTENVGAVVAPKPDELAAALGHWLADETLRRRAGDAGRAFVRKNYDWTNIARNWVSHYASLK